MSKIALTPKGKGPWPSDNGEAAVKKWFVLRICEGVEEGERMPVANLCLDFVSEKQRGGRLMVNYNFPESALDRLSVIADELNKSNPVQYILQEAHFDGLDLFVNDAVLIPRPETEELVQRVAEELGKRFNGTVLDIGTGSGCIALAIKNRLEKAEVVAVDVCDKALEIARENAKGMGLDIRFEKLDILSSVPNSGFDAVISNPPYIPEVEWTEMEKRVKEFEPRKALFVSDDDPLVFYKRIVEISEGGLLNNGGLIAMECHRDYVCDVVELLMPAQGWGKVEIITDLQGNQRHVIAHRSVT